MMDDEVTACIDSQAYPIDTDELAAAVGEFDPAAGDAVLRGGDGAITSADDARLALQCGMGGESVGRKRYSDRDPPGVSEDSHQRLSF
jgi:hypothetical protein